MAMATIQWPITYTAHPHYVVIFSVLKQESRMHHWLCISVWFSSCIKYVV